VTGVQTCALPILCVCTLIAWEAIISLFNDRYEWQSMGGFYKLICDLNCDVVLALSAFPKLKFGTCHWY
jgi:hypothetical protein